MVSNLSGEEQGTQALAVGGSSQAQYSKNEMKDREVKGEEKERSCIPPCPSFPSYQVTESVRF